MNAVVVCRVHRVHREDLLQHGIHRQMAVDREPAAGKLPEAHTEEGAGLEVRRIILNDALQIVDELLLAFLRILGLTVEIVDWAPIYRRLCSAACPSTRWPS